MRTVTVATLASNPESRKGTAASRQLRLLRKAARARNALDAQVTAARLDGRVPDVIRVPANRPNGPQ